MYCTNCGSKMGERGRFCADCGTPCAASREELVTQQRQRVHSASRPTPQAAAVGSQSTYDAVSSVSAELEDNSSTGDQNWYGLHLAPAIAGLLEPPEALHRKRHLRLLGSGLAAIVTSFFLFGSVPILGFLLLVVGIAAVAVTKFEIEWSGAELQKVVTVPGIALVIGVLVVGYMFGLLI